MPVMSLLRGESPKSRGDALQLWFSGVKSVQDHSAACVVAAVDRAQVAGAHFRMHLLRSIAAIACGFVVVGVLSTLTDFLLEHAGILPGPADVHLYNNWHWTLAATYRTGFNVLGGYVTARIAPDRPETHGIILGGIGTAAAAIGAIVSWNIVNPDARWYPLSLVLTALPFCWLGARLYRKSARA
jgi:hypothetical protein